MIPAARDHLLRLAWSVPLVFGPALPRRMATLLYHGVPSAPDARLSAAVFERHLLFLKRHFDLACAPDELRSSAGTARTRVLLTFDDGLRNNAEVVAPILKKHNVPAVFFVSSRHAERGKYLWFAYLEALEQRFRWKELSFRGSRYDMSAAARRQSVRRLRNVLLALPSHPTEMYQAIDEELPRLEDFVSAPDLADRYAGMTSEHVGELAADPLFLIGVHTIDHPFLSRCPSEEARRQLDGNRQWIERASGRRCDLVAYPSGDYNAEVMRLCLEIGLTTGFAVAPRFCGNPSLERARFGIYSPSTVRLGIKAECGHLLRLARIPIG